jgi:hypothetical protein
METYSVIFLFALLKSGGSAFYRAMLMERASASFPQALLIGPDSVIFMLVFLIDICFPLVTLAILTERSSLTFLIERNSTIFTWALQIDRAICTLSLLIYMYSAVLTPSLLVDIDSAILTWGLLMGINFAIFIQALLIYRDSIVFTWALLIVRTSAVSTWTMLVSKDSAVFKGAFRIDI